MQLCGVCLVGFTSTTLLDVVARVVGHPLLWPQEVTSAFFIYGVFIGASVGDAAQRSLAALGLDRGDGRNDAPRVRGHQSRRRHGRRTLPRRLRLAEFPDRLRQFSHAVDAADRLSLRADSAVRRVGGAVQPRTDRQRPAPRLRASAVERRLPDPMPNSAILLIMTLLFLALGYLGVPVAFSLMAGVIVGTMLTPITLQSIVGQAFNGVDSEALMAIPFFLLVGELMTSANVIDTHRRTVAGAGRPHARRARASHHRLQHVLFRHVGLVVGRRRGVEPDDGSPDGEGRLLAGLCRGADRRRLDHRQSGAAEHHGGRLRRSRQCLDRRAVSGRHSARRDGRRRPHAVLLFFRAGRVSPAAIEFPQSRRRGAGGGAAGADPGDPARRHHDRLVHADRSRRRRRRLYTRLS